MKHSSHLGRLRSLTAISAVIVCGIPGGAAAIDIAPHRAIYEMSLDSVRSGSAIADVNGRMMFEWADACDGWTIQQRFLLRFLYAEGGEMEMNTSYVTWEAKDGLSYRFNVRKLINGQLDEEVKGDARIAGPGASGVARFSLPEEVKIDLPPGTMFPTSHTLAVMERAEAGERFFARMIFDGVDAEGATEVSAVVGKPLEREAEAADLDADAQALIQGAGWPILLAFFPAGSDGDGLLPDYQMRLELLENGVARNMLIDYGDFSVVSELTDLEPMPAARC